MHGRGARSGKANDTRRVVLDADNIRARRTCVEGDGRHTTRCADVRVDLRAA